MKTIPRMAALGLLGGFLVLQLHAGQTAVVQQNRVNVRARPTLHSEIVTQLKEGERVEVLEEITIEHPKPDDLARWYRIVMPANTPVWVFADFIDPDKTVQPSRLNVRAGPGENYSIVGRLDRGAKVKEIRRDHGWMEIETPPDCYVYVAADYVVPQPPPPPPPAATPAPAAPVPTEAQPVAPPPAPAEVQPAPPPVVESPPPPPAPEPEPLRVERIEATPTPEPAAPAPQPAVAAPPPVTVPPAPPPEPTVVPTLAPPPPKPPPGPPPKRVVTREGRVSRTYSIQSPTHFGLEAMDTGRVVNYLYGEKIGLKLDGFKGRKVRVTGEEALDKRWPKTPVITIETITLLP